MPSSVGRPVRVEITEIMVSGECPAGLTLGRVWEIRDGMLPEGMCASAWNSIEQYVFALRAGGRMPWNGLAEATVCCPDASNPVVFHVTVIEE